MVERTIWSGNIVLEQHRRLRWLGSGISLAPWPAVSLATAPALLTRFCPRRHLHGFLLSMRYAIKRVRTDNPAPALHHRIVMNELWHIASIAGYVGMVAIEA
jgi:hypothetical protein